VCSFFQCAEKGLKDNATSPSKLSFRCPAASLHQATHAPTTHSNDFFNSSTTVLAATLLSGVCQQERSSRWLGGSGVAA